MAGIRVEGGGSEMVKKMAVGGEDFISLRRSGSYYVDKTELLYELVEETNNTVTLFTRPRRFGKTLTLSMMESFFSLFRKEDSDVFDGLDIMRHSEFCEEYMHQYPVLFLSLKDVEGLTFFSAFKMLRAMIADLCKKFRWLGNETAVSPYDKEIFLRLQAKSVDDEEVQNALKTLMRMMYDVYGKPVILLIDEYDVPLAKAYANGYYREMLEVIRGIMSISLKTNEYLKFAVVTGCLRIPKESLFTGVNNFASYSVLDGRFAQYFGFTHQEVDQMLSDSDLLDKSELIRSWYDGYLFGDEKMYCPWDVVNYISALLFRRDAKPKNYWKNTSGNGAIKEFFYHKEFHVSRKFEVLLNGGSISEPVVDELTYEDVYESEMGLWSLLLMTGYVTLAGPADGDEEDGGEEGQTVDLRIPNREIAGIFQKTVVDHFKRTVDETKLNQLMDALWNGEEETTSIIMSELLLQTISYMDYHEDYYHAFLAGLFRGRGFEVQSNKERGLGRPDLQLFDNVNRIAVIIETKKSAKAEDMEADCQEGIKQIVRNQYVAGLEDFRTVICYGISFFKKKALVKKYDCFPEA